MLGPLTVVLLYLCQSQELVFLVARKVLDRCGRRDKLYGVGLANDLTHIFGFEILFADVAGLVIEEAM